MGVIYDENKQRFFKIESSTVSGLQTDFMQAFYANLFVRSNSSGSLSFYIDLPTYSTSLGTKQYYKQDPNSILTTFSRPCVNFIFSGNVENLSALTLVHDIYRIDWDSYTNFLNCNDREGNNIKNSAESETIREKIFENGKLSEKTTIISREKSQSEDDFNNKNCVTKKEIVDKITQPILSITATTSAITYNTYGIRLPETIKTLGETEQSFFNDRDQFFIDTRYGFTVPDVNDNKELLYYEKGEFKTEILASTGKTYYTVSTGDTISGGTFTGTPVKGEYFTYFKIPNQPLITGGVVEGQLTTFSPKIQFTNVEDGDYYISQVVYNTGDTGFTGTVYTNTYSKQETILASGDPTEKESGNINDYGYYVETTSDTIHEIGLAFKVQQSALYRIGSVKKVFNVFGAKQKVITFSDTYSVTTPDYNLSQKVYIQSDSPNVLAQTSPQPDTKLDDACFLDTGWVFSGMAVGSVVTGATVELRFPSGGSVSKPTDLTGNFTFDDLDSGDYTLITHYRGYEIDIKTVSMSADTYLEYKINLLWSNRWDTWGKLANENYYTGP